MSKRFDAGHTAYLTLNGAIVAFLLMPIAIVPGVRPQPDALHRVSTGRRHACAGS